MMQEHYNECRATKRLIASTSGFVNKDQIPERVLLVNEAGENVDTRTATELNSQFQPIGGAPKLAIIGDSTVRADTGTDFVVHGTRDIANWAHVLSGARFMYVGNAGLGGDDASEALARFDAEITPLTPDVVPIIVGINDAVGGRTLAAYAADIKALVAKCRAIGALPILFTVAPNTNTGTTQQLIAKYNFWLRYYTSSQRIPLVDTGSLLTNPSDGKYATAYDLDGTHQNAAGAKVMGQALATVLTSGVLPNWTPPLPVSNTSDSMNLLTNGLFLTNTAGLGTGWSKGANGTASIVTDSNIVGNWQRITETTAADNTLLQAVTTGYSAGDRMALCGRVAFTEGTSTSQASVLAIAFGPNTFPCRPVTLFTEDIPTTGAFYYEFNVPSTPATTSISVQALITPSVHGNGYIQVAQMALYNLTTMGILTA